MNNHKVHYVCLSLEVKPMVCIGLKYGLYIQIFITEVFTWVYTVQTSSAESGFSFICCTGQWLWAMSDLIWLFHTTGSLCCTLSLFSLGLFTRMWITSHTLTGSPSLMMSVALSNVWLNLVVSHNRKFVLHPVLIQLRSVHSYVNYFSYSHRQPKLDDVSGFEQCLT